MYREQDFFTNQIALDVVMSVVNASLYYNRRFCENHSTGGSIRDDNKG
jgi:hypothetical protein